MPWQQIRRDNTLQMSNGSRWNCWHGQNELIPIKNCKACFLLNISRRIHVLEFYFFWKTRSWISYKKPLHLSTASWYVYSEYSMKGTNQISLICCYFFTYIYIYLQDTGCYLLFIPVAFILQGCTYYKLCLHAFICFCL